MPLILLPTLGTLSPSTVFPSPDLSVPSFIISCYVMVGRCPWEDCTLLKGNGGRIDGKEEKGRLGGVWGCCQGVLYESRINLK